MSPAKAGTTAVAAVLGAAGLLLVLVTWAASIGPDRVVTGGDLDRLAPLESPTSTAPVDDQTAAPDDRPPEQQTDDPAGWVRLLALVVQALTVAVAAYLLLRLLGKAREAWRSRRRREPVPEDVPFEVLGTAGRVGEAIDEDAAAQRAALETDGEPRNAIVACWHRFEVQAARAGVRREPWQTTGEFVLGVLDLVGADHGAVARLADLYREARFSDHPMTESHRSAALAALDDVHASLRVGAGAR